MNTNDLITFGGLDPHKGNMGARLRGLDKKQQ